MTFSLGESHHLVFDTRAVSRPRALNLSAEKRRASYIPPNDVMRSLVGVDDVARNHRTFYLFIVETEWDYLIIARLDFKCSEIDREFEYARRSAGLKSPD